MAYLSLSHISKLYNGNIAVKDFNLDVEKGQLVSFLGPSGCGKTTTLRMIAGFEIPDSGMITLDGQDISKIPPNKRNIGMVFQSYALFPNMTVKDNIKFGLRMQKTDKDAAEKKAMEMLKLVRLTETADRYPNQLSGGQQQRIALARALAIEPRVLLLDEPLSALDAEVRVALRGEIRRIQSSLKITTIYVTHDQEEALSISDRVVVMNKSIIEQIGTPLDVYHHPDTRFVATFIGTANEFKGKIAGNMVRGNEISVIATNTNKFHENDEVVALIRPEKVNVFAAKPAGNLPNLFEGAIDTITFHGAVTRLGISINDKVINADVSVSADNSFNYHQKVWVSFAPDDFQVLA